MNLLEAWEAQETRVCFKLDSFIEGQDRHLRRFQGRPVRMLEIGVLGGGSLDIWQRYLGPDAQIVGIDISPQFAVLNPDFQVHIGDQADAGFIAEVNAQSGPFDIVVDDGGHEMHQQIGSFEALYPLLAEGGCYIVEDTCTSYWDSFQAGVNVPGTFIEYVKDLIDDLNGDFHGGVTEFTRSTTSMHVYQGMVAFEKQRNDPTQYLLSVNGEISKRGMLHGLGFAD
jgi:Methyltransferase domain